MRTLNVCLLALLLTATFAQEPCPNADEYRYDGECVPTDCINYTTKLADLDLAFSLTNDGNDVVVHIQFDNMSNAGQDKDLFWPDQRCLQPMLRPISNKAITALETTIVEGATDAEWEVQARVPINELRDYFDGEQLEDGFYYEVQFSFEILLGSVTQLYYSTWGVVVLENPTSALIDIDFDPIVRLDPCFETRNVEDCQTRVEVNSEILFCVNETEASLQQETCLETDTEYDGDLTVGAYFKILFRLTDETFADWGVTVTQIVFKSIANQIYQEVSSQFYTEFDTAVPSEQGFILQVPYAANDVTIVIKAEITEPSGRRRLVAFRRDLQGSSTYHEAESQGTIGSTCEADDADCIQNQDSTTPDNTDNNNNNMQNGDDDDNNGAIFFVSMIMLLGFLLF